MKVYTHVVTDQLEHNPRYFGISTDEDGTGYQKAMDWINEHQEYRGGERYEYERNEYDLNFVWKLTEDGFEKIRFDKQDTDVFGAMHVGKILVEFRCNGGGFDDDYHECMNDVYVFGESDEVLDLWVKDNPYKLLDDEIYIPKRRTVESFKRACERSMLDFLNAHTDLIKFAVTDTVVDLWY